LLRTAHDLISNYNYKIKNTMVKFEIGKKNK